MSEVPLYQGARVSGAHTFVSLSSRRESNTEEEEALGVEVRGARTTTSQKCAAVPRRARM